MDPVLCFAYYRVPRCALRGCREGASVLEVGLFRFFVAGCDGATARHVWSRGIREQMAAGGGTRQLAAGSWQLAACAMRRRQGGMGGWVCSRLAGWQGVWA